MFVIFIKALLNYPVDFSTRHSLSAGGPALLVALLLRGLPLIRTPAGVSCLPLQSTECQKTTISFNRDIIKEKGVTAYFKRAKIKTFPVA
jgi:hypothetical protein